jgi:magnesium and cobalt transporter
MGSLTEGSSSAAQGAQDPERYAARGLLGRLRAILSTPKPVTGISASVPNGAAAPQVPAVLLPGMSNLRRMRVYDVAVPKAEIVAVPVTIRRDDLVKVFRDSGLTRIPVYKGTLDSPLGFVHLKDFALTHGFDGSPTRFNLRKMVRPLIYAPPSMPIGILLQKMQSSRAHMALVIDEYGGVDGLVTLEDLVEQVIGEIEDEHDTAEGRLWSEEAPGYWLAQARAPLSEFEATIGRRLVPQDEDAEEIDTLGGLVFVLIGRVPARGEVIPHPEAGVEFEVVDADPRRIKRLRVRLRSDGDDVRETEPPPGVQRSGPAGRSPADGQADTTVGPLPVPRKETGTDTAA